MSDLSYDLLNRLDARAGNLARSYDGQGPIAQALIETVGEIVWGLRDGSIVVLSDDVKKHLLKLVEIAEDELEGHDWTENPKERTRYGDAIEGVRSAFRLSWQCIPTG